MVGQNTDTDINKWAMDDYDIRTTKYRDAISSKFDNRRVSIIDEGKEGYILEFKRIDNDYKEDDYKYIELQRKNLVVSSIPISQEAGELIMFQLAELMGYEITDGVVENDLSWPIEESTVTNGYG